MWASPHLLSWHRRFQVLISFPNPLFHFKLYSEGYNFLQQERSHFKIGGIFFFSPRHSHISNAGIWSCNIPVFGLIFKLERACFECGTMRYQGHAAHKKLCCLFSKSTPEAFIDYLKNSYEMIKENLLMWRYFHFVFPIYCESITTPPEPPAKPMKKLSWAGKEWKSNVLSANLEIHLRLISEIAVADSIQNWRIICGNNMDAQQKKSVFRPAYLGVSWPNMDLLLGQVTFVRSLWRTQVDAHILGDVEVWSTLVVIHVFNCGQEKNIQTILWKRNFATFEYMFVR